MRQFQVGDLVGWHHEPKASAIGKRVLIVHGLGEHSGRHLSTVEFLVSHGFDVCRFDQRGCGASGGPRQWIERFDDYVDDVQATADWIRRELADLPIYVLGHSLGGAIAAHYAAREQARLSGLILSAPAYLPGAGVSPIKIAAGRLLNRIAPKLRVPGSLDITAISRDPVEVARCKDDPLYCRFNTVRQGNAILDTLPNMPSVMAKLTLPLLIAHGTADRLVKVEGSRELFNACPSKDKTLKLYEGGYHELHNDTDRVRYFADLLAWLTAH